MMKPIRPNLAKGASYPTEFREEAVRSWLSSGQTLSAVAADLGLSPQCLRSWRQQMDSTSSEPTVDGNTGNTGTATELAQARAGHPLGGAVAARVRGHDAPA